MMHYGRKRAACGAKATRVTTIRAHVKCPACLVEISGRELLAAFRRDLDGA
jgi:hypothetical protein